MRQTTTRLVDRLHAISPGSYRVDVAELADDSEVIHLHGGDYVLTIDEYAGLATVSLDEQMELGGNVTIADWVVNNDADLDEIVAAALDVENGLRCGQTQPNPDTLKKVPNQAGRQVMCRDAL
jgi:hypothetical protein